MLPSTISPFASGIRCAQEESTANLDFELSEHCSRYREPLLGIEEPGASFLVICYSRMNVILGGDLLTKPAGAMPRDKVLLPRQDGDSWSHMGSSKDLGSFFGVLVRSNLGNMRGTRFFWKYRGVKCVYAEAILSSRNSRALSSLSSASLSMV